MYTASNWPWSRTLAMAGKGQLFQVESILFDTIRDYLEDMGIRRGSILECVDNRPLAIVVHSPDGQEREISRAYAWFVCVTELASSSFVSPFLESREWSH